MLVNITKKFYMHLKIQIFGTLLHASQKNFFHDPVKQNEMNKARY